LNVSVLRRVRINLDVSHWFIWEAELVVAWGSFSLQGARGALTASFSRF